MSIGKVEVLRNEMNNTGRITVFENLKPHLELIAAMTSGILILLGWILTRVDFDSLSVMAYLFAFVIGGFAKAKEGIEDTLESRELNVEMLMIFAAIGSAIIGYWAEGAILIFIFSLSGALETYTMNKNKREISALVDLQPEEATVIRHGQEERIHISRLMVGDNILIKPGERIPVDGKVTQGNTMVDQAAITGEAIPVIKGHHDEVFAGTVNVNGSIIIEMTKPSTETLFQKIIDLVQSAQSEKSPSQLFIEKFEGAYVKCVLLAVGLMMVLPHFLLNWSWTETFYRAMILLVVASPCALVASIMPATLSAISNGAKRGILFKGGMHIERLSNILAIAFDKTGTLTKGKPEVTNVIVRDGLSIEAFLNVTASIEKHSTHPLAQSIVNYSKGLQLPLTQPDGIEDMAGFGVTGKIGGKVWKIGKAEFVGKKEAETFHNGISKELAGQGKTIVFAQDEDGIAGLIALKDVVREETSTAVEKLANLGIHTIMLTGDSRQTASVIAAESHVKGYISDCLPETKVEKIKELLEKYGDVAMVGDGINDAPALATSSVGIAMGEGTDVALETADVVLMKNDLTKIAEAIKLSKRMNRIVKQNIVFSILVIITLICSNFFQILDLPFGVIGHEGSTILVILNGLRLLKQ